MKKIFALILTGIIGLSVLTGCAGDPVADEFEKFLNTDMVEVNAKYEDLKTEMNKWDELNDEELIASINDVVLPNINDSLDMLSKIELKTDEVKSIKAKYKKMLETYKGAYGLMLTAIENDDEDKVNEASDKLDKGLKQLDDYNNALEKLAKEYDMTIEY